MKPPTNSEAAKDSACPPDPSLQKATKSRKENPWWWWFIAASAALVLFWLPKYLYPGGESSPSPENQAHPASAIRCLSPIGLVSTWDEFRWQTADSFDGPVRLVISNRDGSLLYHEVIPQSQVWTFDRQRHPALPTRLWWHLESAEKPEGSEPYRSKPVEAWLQDG
ncbi:MAG: hypothetical protein DWQ01_05990 [Planctomycetota bacterium]|nr:MAG: hypothetical protein DWQ01_05990 [Planctomycetota bacterium]